MSSTAVAWPNGKRIAVAITVMFETWPDDKWPPFSVQTTALKPGTRDNSAATWGQYGGRVGVWRLIRLFDRHGIPATFCANARCAEIYGDAVLQIVKSGHDIAGHGYTQDELLAYQTPEQERATIIRCLDTIAARTGKRPEGWCSPVLAWTQHTDDFLAEQKLLYRADANYIDMPRRIDTKFGPLAHVPHSDFTDQRVLRTAPQIYFDVYKDAFDYLYRDEPMAMLELVLHCHWGGRPLMTAVADRLFTYFRQFPDVWFARHSELARWALDADPEQSTYQRRFFS